MKCTPLRNAIGTAVFVVLSATGCGPSDGSTELGEDEVEIVPFPSTLVLGDAELRALAPEQGDGLLVFSESSPSLSDLAPGKVLVAGKSASTPNGLLRIVKSVRVVGDGLELETLHAPIQLAFRRVHIKTVRRSTGQLGSEPWPGSDLLVFDPYKRHVGATQQVEVIVFDGDGDRETVNDQIAIDGELGGAIDFSFRLDFDWGSLEDLPQIVEDCISGLLELDFSCSLPDLLPEAKAVFDAEPSLASHLQLHGAAILDFEKEIVLYDSNVGQLVYPGIVITPNVKILAKVEGSASAAFSTSVDAAVKFKTSVTLSSKHPSTPSFDPPKLSETSFDARPPELTLRAEAKAGLGAELSLLLYGVTGPFLSARAFAAIEADVFRNPCLELSAGLDGSLGVKLTTPGFLFLDPIDLLDWRADFEGVNEVLDVPLPACEAPADASTLPPGSGPDARNLAMPAFDPWSRSFSGLADGLSTITGGISHWFDQQRSIDGRVVIAGRGANALTKLDENGNLVWARRLFADSTKPNTLLHPVRTVASPDAGIYVLAEGNLPPLTLLKVSQAGNVTSTRELDIPDPVGCGLKPVALVRGAEASLTAIVACTLSDKVHVVHLNDALEVLEARSFSDSEFSAIEPSVATWSDGELFISGRLSGETDSMFALRLDAQGELVTAHRYVACEEGPDVFPMRVVNEESGDVTVAGRGGAQHNGFVAKLKRDGSVGFASFPGFGFGAGSVFVLDSLAQLTTTGYIVSASTVSFTSEAPANVPSIALLHLDAVGKPIWARRYTLQSAGGDYLDAAQSAFHLTDDGGILVTAAAKESSASIDASLWAMKVFAKDGQIDFLPGAATSTPIDSIQALPCSLEALPWTPALAEEPEVTTRSSAAESVHFSPESAEQTR